ncbi:hypothetical protein [Paenibacillus physcomitrellae]|uniref:F0F1-type ATP synthase n=1 Tax=Paenibacillus physcomitrellae TaxID=1619311 RepID=A0ABQ1FRB9_9BACL|nr:hypothetical protein [Paenibacillus physcomitrellae]GGA25026.1 hypothetical protein GCM10010917_07420 [Paenibacillus physcomitrellae]
MKITEWAIVFVLLASPLLWISSVHTDQLREVFLLEQRYNSVLRTAVQDGASRLDINEQPSYEAGYASDKYFRVDKQAGLDALLKTLFLNFNLADDPLGQQAFMLYIPAVVVLEYDGYSIYGVQERKEPDGTALNSAGWFPKKPYAYTDAAGNALSFTLDSRLTLLDQSQGVFLQGSPEELALMTDDPLLKNLQLLDAARRTTIVSSVERDLERILADHNRLAERAGVNYTFTLPRIPDETWNNTIDDAGMLVFLQGIPLGDQFYNNFAFGGGRLLKKEPVIGGIDERTGVKYYYRRNQCGGVYRTEEVFASERDAAASGYFEARCTIGK